MQLFAHMKENKFNNHKIITTILEVHTSDLTITFNRLINSLHTKLPLTRTLKLKTAANKIFPH